MSPSRKGRRTTRSPFSTNALPAELSTDLSQLSAQVVNLVPDASCVLETKILRRLVHLFFELQSQAPQLVGSAADGLPPAALGLVRHGGISPAPESGDEDVAHGLADRLRVDAVLLVVRHLYLTTTLGLVDGPPHRI